MKIKLKDKNIKLPNCWKQCGASKEDWEELQAGSEIDVKSTPDSIKGLVEVAFVPSSKKIKGDK